MRIRLARLRDYAVMVAEVKAISEALDKRRITAAQASEAITRL